MTNCDSLSNTLRASLAPWFLGDLDRFVEDANKMHRLHLNNNYPPHNVYRIDDNTLVLQMALAGIDPKDLKLVFNGSKFTISYEPEPKPKEVSIYAQYKSISTKRFAKSFKLEEPWEITNATFTNGLLEVTVSQTKEPEKYIEIKVK